MLGSMTEAGPSAVADAAGALGMGRLAVVVDEARAEASLVAAAGQITAATVAFTVRHTSGFLCVALTGTRAGELGVPPMACGRDVEGGNPFLVSLDARHGITTGISAHDRAATIRCLADRQARPDDFARPGHVMPIEVHPGGILERAGPAEAAVELCRLAGSPPVALVSTLVTEDALQTLGPVNAKLFAQRHRLPMVTVAELVLQRCRTAPALRRVREAEVLVAGATFRVVTYRSQDNETEHVAAVLGDVSNARGVVVEVHDSCPADEMFGEAACACRGRLAGAAHRIVDRGAGVLLRMHTGGAVRATTEPFRCPNSNPHAGRSRAIVDFLLNDLQSHTEAAPAHWRA